MADREDGPRGRGSAPGFDVERAGEVTEHRVARLADVDTAASTAPIASLHDIDGSARRASVVDLRDYRRSTGDRAAEPDVFAEPTVTSQTPRALRSDSSLCEDGGDGTVRGRSTVPGRQPEPGSDPVAIAREICLRLLTGRAHTRGELAVALRKRGVPEDAAQAVLERFDEVGLIDDAAFAGQWVRARHGRRGLARRAIAVELRRKGVADEVAQDALAEVDSASEERRARELVDRKLRTIPTDTPEQRTSAARRLVGMLGRRGYPSGTAYAAVRAALAAHGAEDDELGPAPDL